MPDADIPAVVGEQWDWQVRSACRGMSAAVFFNPDNERGAAKRRRESAAKAVCRACPVLRECLTWALMVREPYGVWGATTPDDRSEIMAGRRSAADIIADAERANSRVG